MADIFLSYASGDRERVRPLVEALEVQGWSVWWDRHIQPGQSFDNVIQRELDAARCVIVAWTQESIRSEWVKNEATIGLNRGVLVPVLFDRVTIPLPFIRTQCADLVEWSPEVVTPEIRDFLNAVASNLDVEPATLDIQPLGKRRNWRRMAMAAGLVAMVVAFGVLLTRISSGPSLFESVPDNSITVAPFEDLTPTYDQQWIGGAIVSTLRIALPGRGLQVIGSGSYQDNQSPRTLTNARYRLQGTVMRLPTMIRVTAELVLVENDHQLWADEFIAHQEIITSDLTAQNDIAKKIVGAVAKRINSTDEPTLVAVRANAPGGGSLQNLMQGNQSFPEFPSMDEEAANE